MMTILLGKHLRKDIFCGYSLFTLIAFLLHLLWSYTLKNYFNECEKGKNWDNEKMLRIVCFGFYKVENKTRVGKIKELNEHYLA